VRDCTCWRRASTSAAVAGVVFETVGAGDEFAEGIVSCAKTAVTGKTASTTKTILFIPKLLIQKTRRSRRMNFAFAHVDSAASRNALNAATRLRGKESAVQECTGGACSKMRAPRNGDSTQCGVSAGIFGHCTAVAGTIISGAPVL